MSKIHEAIVAVMNEVGAIGKDSKNEQQHYNYRSIEQVYNRVQPLFAKHGIFSYPKVIEQTREAGKSKSGGTLHYAILTVEYTFSAEDGSSIVVTVVGEGMDSGDKASNKAMAAAHKYALCQVLNIPYQVIDPDANTPEWAAKLSSNITRKRLGELKKAWLKVNFDGLAGADDEEIRQRFRKWVQKTIGANFALGGDLDVNDWASWPIDDMETCEKALEAMPARPSE